MLRRWSVVLAILAVSAALTLPDAPSPALAAWGVAKLAAFGLLGLVLDRALTPYARPHKLRADATIALRMLEGGSPSITGPVVAQAMRSADSADMRRALTVLGCQIAGALL